MTGVPDLIRQEVLTQWLQGIARDLIAKNVDIGKGTVSRIDNIAKSTQILIP
jgi:hypothetical protein